MGAFIITYRDLELFKDTDTDYHTSSFAQEKKNVHKDATSIKNIYTMPTCVTGVIFFQMSIGCPSHRVEDTCHTSRNKLEVSYQLSYHQADKQNIGLLFNQ